MEKKYEKFAVDLHFFFKHSAARREEFELARERKMYHHITKENIIFRNTFIKKNKQFDDSYTQLIYN